MLETLIICGLHYKISVLTTVTMFVNCILTEYTYIHSSIVSIINHSLNLSIVKSIICVNRCYILSNL